MAGGPLFPYSRFPVNSGLVFPYTYVGGGANSKHETGMGVAASLGSNAIWRLRFLMPPALPTGVGKLRTVALANAVSGAAKINFKWASVAMGESPSAATLLAEGTQTLTWTAADVYNVNTINLDADTLVANEVVVADLTFETTGWTLAVVSLWTTFIIWE